VERAGGRFAGERNRLFQRAVVVEAEQFVPTEIRLVLPASHPDLSGTWVHRHAGRAPRGDVPHSQDIPGPQRLLLLAPRCCSGLNLRTTCDSLVPRGSGG